MLKNLDYLSALIVMLICFSCSTENESKLPAKPNVIVIVADDLGWSDLSAYGNSFIETPNLDRLAKKGTQFTNAYAPASLCSPSRASIVTGMHPVRVNITEHIHGNFRPQPHLKLITPNVDQALDTSWVTTAEAIQQLGYQTIFIGKWHLGGGKNKPGNQGFDHTYAASYHGLPNSFYYPFFNHGMKDIKADAKDGDYLTDVLTDHAINQIKSADSSFLMYLNFYSPHVPIEGRNDLVEKYVTKAGGQDDGPIPNPHYAAMVEAIDQNVGRLIDSLEAYNKLKNTVIIFTSDNGGLSVREVPAFAKHTPPTDNFPLNKGKGYLHEGGIRVPFIVYNEHLESSGEKLNYPVTGTDIHATILSLTGLEIPENDGKSLKPILDGEDMTERTLFWHVPHYSPQGGKPVSAIRKGDFKLIYSYEDGSVELYDLSKDLAEANNLAKEMPEKAQELLDDLNRFKKRYDANVPTTNPDYEG